MRGRDRMCVFVYFQCLRIEICLSVCMLFVLCVCVYVCMCVCLKCDACVCVCVLEM